MNGPGLFAAGLLLLVTFFGCKGIEMPSWFHPGSAEVQRSRALRYDPYPENEIGPAVVGVRPREFDKPPPEASRARWHLGGWEQQQ